MEQITKGRVLLLSMVFALSVCSLNCSTRIKSPRREGRLWNVCVHKIPHLIKTGAEGALAIYAAYLAVDWAIKTHPDLARLLDNPEGLSSQVMKDLLRKGCTMLGLSFLSFKSAEACVYDLDIL